MNLQIIFLFLMVIMTCLFQVLNGRLKSYLLIPNGKYVRSPCDGTPWGASGHAVIETNEDMTPLNQFGKDFRDNEFTWNEKLCNKDSDSDGKTNGEELGDPDCLWVAGQNMIPAKKYSSHPGICEPPETDYCKSKNAPFYKHADLPCFACRASLTSSLIASIIAIHTIKSYFV